MHKYGSRQQQKKAVRAVKKWEKERARLHKDVNLVVYAIFCKGRGMHQAKNVWFLCQFFLQYNLTKIQISLAASDCSMIVSNESIMALRAIRPPRPCAWSWCDSWVQFRSRISSGTPGTKWANTLPHDRVPIPWISFCSSSSSAPTASPWPLLRPRPSLGPRLCAKDLPLFGWVLRWGRDRGCWRSRSWGTQADRPQFLALGAKIHLKAELLKSLWRLV